MARRPACLAGGRPRRSPLSTTTTQVLDGLRRLLGTGTVLLRGLGYASLMLLVVSWRWRTGSTQGHWPFPQGQEETGYAYILTHPGMPCIL